MRARVQPLLVAPRSGPGRGRADDHRRARPRHRHRSGARDGPAAPVMPQADLAQPAVALRGVRAKIIRHEGDAAACRRVPPRAQSRKPGNADRRDQQRGAAPERGGNRTRNLRPTRRMLRAMNVEGAAMSDTADIMEQAARWREMGKQVALATVVNTWGSSPRPIGSKLAVDNEGAFVGSVSGGCVEGAVIEEALAAMRDGRPRLLDFGVTNEQAWEVGLACGGKIEIFVERVE